MNAAIAFLHRCKKLALKSAGACFRSAQADGGVIEVGPSEGCDLPCKKSSRISVSPGSENGAEM
jgi:hypothetical protein